MSFRLWLGIGCALLVTCLPSFAGENIAPSQEIATLAAKPVVIDGNLSEWDASVKLGPVSFDEEVADEYNGTFYAMYDNDYLYAAAVIVEPHPPYNTYPTKGIQQDNADEVIIRLSGNPKLVPPIVMSDEEASHSKDLFILELWRNNITKETVWKGRRGLSFLTYLLPKELLGVQAVVKPAANGKGYTLEARIPWAVVNPTLHPKAGDKLVFLWEVIIANDSPAEPRRTFQIFANGATAESFRSTAAWNGQLLFK